MKLIIPLFTFLFSLTVYSSQVFSPLTVSELPLINKGGWSSGGGNAIVCFNPDFALDAISKINDDGSFPDILFEDMKYIDSIQVLDLFEARLMRGAIPPTRPKIIGLTEDEDILQYVSRVSYRFNKTVSTVEEIVLKGIRLIPQANIRFYDGAVTQNDDIGSPSIINNKLCRITTIANQRNQNGFYELYIDSRAFTHIKHEKLSQAALLLHEFVYATARSRGEKNSLTTRKLVEILMTRHPDFTVDYISKIITDLNFSSIWLPDSDSYRRYIYNADLIKVPTLLLRDLVVMMGDATKLYSPKGFSRWIEKFKNVLKENGIIFDTGYSLDLEFFLSWYKSNLHDLPDTEKLDNLFKELESFALMRTEFLRETYQYELDRITKISLAIPATASDRELMQDVIIGSYDHYINMSKYYSTDESGRLQNNLINMGDMAPNDRVAAIWWMWSSAFSLNNEISLSNKIP